MPNAKQELVDDVHFIFSEIARFRALERQWFETKSPPPELREGYLWELPHPTDKHNKFPCGRAGMTRLEGLARQAADRAGIGKQIDILTIRTPLAKALIRRFVLERREISISQVERALSEAARIAKRSLGTVTHYVPCHLMTAQSPDQFVVGPVRFLNRKSFRRVIAQRLWRSRSENRGVSDYLGHVTKYYKSFGWVAEVSIQQCDEKLSEKMATQAVTYALDCLQLFFGPSHTSEMTVGGPAIHHDRRGKFTVKNDSIHISASYRGAGEVGFEDDWPKFFADSDGQHLLALFGVALESAVDPSLDRPLSARFLDAVSWYGEATREKVLAARIVKYVTALERMLMTDEKDNITDLISQRTAAFCADPRTFGDFASWQSKTQIAYGLRSKLVHGSLSQRDSRVANEAWQVHEVVQAAILNALSAFAEGGLKAIQVKRGEMADWFNRVVAHSNRMEASFAAKRAGDSR